MTTQQIDTEQIKTRYDLREISAKYVTLRKASTKELEGACPKCGGTDRFHCQTGWFMCRQCHPERGDVIEFFRWKDGLSFVDVCNLLSNGEIANTAQRREPAVKERKQSAQWRENAKRLSDLAHPRHFKYLGHTDEVRKAFLDRFYFDDGFNAVYDAWIAHEKDKWRYPSLDHINPKANGGNFEIDNLRFITWFENRAKADMPLADWESFKSRTNTKSDLFIEVILESYRSR